MIVEWPDRRQDVLNALDILSKAGASADEADMWPTTTDAVHWLVDDTFWDVRDPAEDIGALLANDEEAAAIRGVVACVVAVSEGQGPTASDQAWFEDPQWPNVRDSATRAAKTMRSSRTEGESNG